jgi:hypothetical protein
MRARFAAICASIARAASSRPLLQFGDDVEQEREVRDGLAVGALARLGLVAPGFLCAQSRVCWL